MKRVVKSDIDLGDVTNMGLLSMWQDAGGRSDILDAVSDLSSGSILEVLQDNLDDESFQNIVMLLAEQAME